MSGHHRPIDVVQNSNRKSTRNISRYAHSMTFASEPLSHDSRVQLNKEGQLTSIDFLRWGLVDVNWRMDGSQSTRRTSLLSSPVYSRQRSYSDLPPASYLSRSMTNHPGAYGSG